MMTSPDLSSRPWRVRTSRPEDADAIVALLNRVFGRWGDRAKLHWKYQLPPAPFRSPSAVAELGGQIIGHFGIVPVEAVFHGETIRGAQTVDAAVLPAYRGFGIHTSLGRYVLDEAAKAGLDFIYAFPGLFSLPVDERIGYTPVAFVPEMTLVLHPWLAFKSALSCLPGDLRALWAAFRQKAWPADTIHRLARLRRSLLVVVGWLTDPVLPWPRRFRPVGVNVARIDAFDIRFDRLWAALYPAVDLAVTKGAAYLSWRYIQNPGEQYQIFTAESAEDVQGFLVLRQVGACTEIVEWVVLPGHSEVASALLAVAIERANQAGSLILSIWASVSHPYQPQLRGAGFVSLGRLNKLAGHWPLLARRLYRVIIYARHLLVGKQNEMMAQASTWPVSLGDSDLA